VIRSPKSLTGAPRLRSSHRADSGRAKRAGGRVARREGGGPNEITYEAAVARNQPVMVHVAFAARFGQFDPPEAFGAREGSLPLARQLQFAPRASSTDCGSTSSAASALAWGEGGFGPRGRRILDDR